MGLIGTSNGNGFSPSQLKNLSLSRRQVWLTGTLTYLNFVVSLSLPERCLLTLEGSSFLPLIPVISVSQIFSHCTRLDSLLKHEMTHPTKKFRWFRNWFNRRCRREPWEHTPRPTRPIRYADSAGDFHPAAALHGNPLDDGYSVGHWETRSNLPRAVPREQQKRRAPQLPRVAASRSLLDIKAPPRLPQRPKEESSVRFREIQGSRERENEAGNSEPLCDPSGRRRRQLLAVELAASLPLRRAGSCDGPHRCGADHPRVLQPQVLLRRHPPQRWRPRGEAIVVAARRWAEGFGHHGRRRRPQLPGEGHPLEEPCTSYLSREGPHLPSSTISLVSFSSSTLSIMRFRQSYVYCAQLEE